MSAMKLIYFDNQGRGEIIRLVMAASNMSYEDMRISREEWPQIKPSIVFKQLPVLRLENGTEMNESMAIARHLARSAQLYGDNDWEIYLVDRTCDTVHDLFSKIVDIHHTWHADKKEEWEKNFENTELSIYLINISKYIEESGGDFVAGTKASLGDLALVMVAEYLGDLVVAKYPRIKNTFNKTLEALPGLQSYIANRKQQISLCH